METKIKLYVIEDDEIIAESLRYFIEQEEEFVYLGGSHDAETGLEELEFLKPDVLLLDVSLPGISGVEALPLLKKNRPALNVLMLTVHEDSETVFAALRNGAVGYILKGLPPKNLFINIKEVLNGGAPISPSIARSIIETFRVENIPSMSDRELQVLNKLSEGSNNSQIAKELFVSTNTIKAHVKNIYKKLHVHSRAAAIRKGIKKGLIR